MNPVVARSVYGRREAQAHRVHTAIHILEREILAAATRRVRAVERGRIGLRGGPALGQSRDHVLGERRGGVERDSNKSEKKFHKAITSVLLRRKFISARIKSACSV